MRFLRLTIVFFAAVFVFGCSRESEDFYKNALAAIDNGDEAGAKKYLLQEIAVNDTPEAHLQFARICARSDADAGLAAWHYRRYAESTEGSDKTDVERLAKECELRFVDYCIRVLTHKEYSSLEEMRDRMRMIEEQSQRQKRWMEQLEAEKNALNKQLLELRLGSSKERRSDGK